MPRIRTLKPEMWSSPQVMNLSANARLLFIGLITQSDDEGRGTADARRLKATVFPGDECTLDQVRGWLAECAEQRLVTIYEADEHGALYELPTWRQHQSIDRPKPSVYPSSTIDRRLIDDESTEDREGSEGKGREHIRQTSDDVQRVFSKWQTVHDHPQSKLDGKRSRLILAALKNYTADQLCACIEGYKRSEFHQGKNKDGKVYDGLSLMLRDAEHIDAGIKLTQGGAQKWL